MGEGDGDRLRFLGGSANLIDGWGNKETNMKTITDSATQTTARICRTFRSSDGAARLHVTEDRKVWLDCTDGGPGNMTWVGTLGDRGSGTTMTRENARRAANQ